MYYYQQTQTQQQQYTHQQQQYQGKPENINHNSSNAIIVVSWNISSLKPTTLQIIKEKQPHIICLQESRQKIKSSPSYTFFNKLRLENPNQGGGINVGIHKQLKCRDISHLLPILHPQLECLLIQCVNKQVEIFLMNVYSPISSYFQKSKLQINQFSAALMKKKPNSIFIFCGDINNSETKIYGLKDTIPQGFTTFQRKQKDRLVQSKTDILMISEDVVAEYSGNFEQVSDHSINTCKLQIDKKHKNKIEYQYSIIKENIYKLNIYCNQAQSFKEFYSSLLENKHKFQCFRRRICGLESVPKRNQRDIDWMKKEIERILRSPNSKKGYQLINKLIITQPLKRDGGIMDCYIQDDELVICDRLIQQNIVNQLAQYQTIIEFNPKSLPQLSPITRDEFNYMKSKISAKKALTDDLISDVWLKKYATFEQLNDVWGDSTRQIVKEFGQFRIVPLNKVYPQIPNASEFRPITILSPLYKWLELRFMKKLNDYCDRYIIKEQIGFIHKLGTSPQIVRLVHDMQSFNKAKNRVVIFIDFKSAYNTTNLSKLFAYMRRKEVLNQKELDFIEALISNQYIVCDGKNVRFQNGVPQGSIISPALFNIYTDLFMNQLLDNKMKGIIDHYYLYADDLAFICRQSKVKQLIERLQFVSRELNMNINYKKCAVMIIRGEQEQHQDASSIMEIPIVLQYKYLGVWIDNIFYK